MSTDWDCFHQARQGDEAAWRMLVGQHQPRLTALALFITGSAAAADDVVQETFVRAFRARIRSASGTVNGFLGTIAYRLALKESKRLSRHVPLAETELVDVEASPLDAMISNERERGIAEAIRNLDTAHRDVLILRLYNECSYEEIAAILRVPLGTVKSRIFYAVKACRAQLQNRGLLP